MNTSKRAVAQMILMLPAIVFMGSLVLRNIQPLQPAAERVVAWYAARMWTLWVLLLALPMTAFVCGCATLFGSRTHDAALLHAQQHAFAAIHFDRRALVFVSLLTLTAAVVLAIVVLHMAAN